MHPTGSHSNRVQDLINMKKIKLTQGKYALVDNEDFDVLNQYKWYFHKAGYALRTCHKPRNGKKQETYKVYMHHVIAGKYKGLQIDHKNMNTLDNRRDNLRVCTATQNALNRSKVQRNATSTSVFKGVYWNKKENRWYVRLAQRWVGSFKNEKKAAQAYNFKARELFGEFALLNNV